MLLYGVPLVWDSNGNLPSPSDLNKEIGRNSTFKGMLLLAPPCWLYNPKQIKLDQQTSSIIVTFHDPDKKVFNILTQSHNTVAMYSTFVTVHPFENQPFFSQCE
jgi:hypothetical protein